MTGIIRNIGATLALLSAFIVPRSEAGQLVSPADREWAKKAVAGEKSLSAPAGKNTVAVLYFNNITGDPSLDPMRKGIPLLLVTDLSGVPGLSVIERTRLQALTEETSLGASGLVEAGTAPRVGKLLGARWLVGGEIGREKPTRIDLTSNVADVPAGTTTGKTSAGGDIERLFEVEKNLLFGVLKLIDVKVTPEEEQRLRKPCSKSVTALSALFLGVDAGDRGDLDKAEGYYKKALQVDPGVCIASDALKEIESVRAAAGKRSRQFLKTLRDGTTLNDSLTTKEPLLRGGKPLDIPGTRTSPTNINLTFP
ncbi:MAG: CsgG/HfaB family protein, partial [Desulfobacteria bacterium]